MVRRLKENNGYLNVSKDYDRLVLNAIELAKQTGCEQIIYVDKDGFYGSVKSKSGKPITPLRDDDEIIGKIRVVNRDGKRDAVYITDYPAVQESKKRVNKRSMRESFYDWSEEEQLSKINFALNLLIEAWDDCNDLLLDARIDGDLLEDIIAEDYPFDRSLEEMDVDVNNWLYDCITRVVEKQRQLNY